MGSITFISQGTEFIQPNFSSSSILNLPTTFIYCHRLLSPTISFFKFLSETRLLSTSVSTNSSKLLDKNR